MKGEFDAIELNYQTMALYAEIKGEKVSLANKGAYRRVSFWRVEYYMSRLRKLSFTLLVALGGYVLVMGIWSFTLKCLALSNHDVNRGWDTLERFVPSNSVAYALITAAAVAVLGLRWTNKVGGPRPGNLTR